ncbi:alpha-1,2-fucosyltransferase [Geomobilimonas luticola]|uniref:Alpha-1,2-fucosyltransferase n=1 Tax=Geomobilimonas luticola TaxID=1114878 RepID=A0ABS5SCD3_9BACT|nr:alpha-1,2-fucosyltransferase [Geomobilimonas luticola]MBT0653028.1 alpha-1,2-fucosyltransferase [Geomobilimonas luticola]
MAVWSWQPRNENAEEMIVVCLKGGLGNQMFQYAAARRLAHQHSTELKIDLSFLESCQSGFTHRSYELCHFSISAAIASPREVAEITGRGNTWRETMLVRFRHATGLATLYRNIYREPHFHFDPTVLGLPDNIYLTGYWQSERYFKDIEETIRNEFTVRHPLTGKNQELAAMIQSTNSVALHVRRGDFVSDPLTMETHGFCEPHYYQRCVGEIVARVAEPNFIVFSDDPVWTRANIHIPFPLTVIDHNLPDKGVEDLRLMSLCKHNIISNSSFSWWGAWLNANKGKIVLSPAEWLKDKRHDTADIIPDGWLKI